MKILVFSVISVFLLLVLSQCGPVRQMPDSKILSVEYIKQGTRAYPDKVRSFSLQPDGQYKAYMADNGEEADSIMCGAEVADKIFECLKKGKIQNYKERYKPKMRIHDGYTWSIKVKFEKGESITSGGYMAYPRDFSAVKGFIDIIEGLFKK